MSAHVELTNLRWVPQGFSLMTRTARVGEDEFTVPMPCQFLDGPVAVVPQLDVDEQTPSLTWRLDRWTVTHTDRKQSLPVSTAGMAAAVRAAREFEADPGISWSSDEVEIGAWASAWVERENARMRGEA